MSDTREQLIDLAEQAIAERGYASFSFRELASEMGIKSASVHYHFPTKTDLGLAVTERYLDRFTQALALIDERNPSPAGRVRAYVQMYRDEAESSERMTVCIMLSAERAVLPDAMCADLARFYRLNLDWLCGVVAQTGVRADSTKARNRASQVLALLQGALLSAKTLNEMAMFDAATQAIEPLVFR